MHVWSEMNSIRNYTRMICPLLVAVITVACHGGGGSRQGANGQVLSGYEFVISDILSSAQATVSPPVGNPAMSSPGLTLTDKASEVDVQIVSPPTIVGDTLYLTVEVTQQVSLNTVNRARVVITGLDTASATLAGPAGFGYMNGDPYVVLGNILPGETVTVVLEFLLAVPHPDSFTFNMDVVQVEQRIAYLGTTDGVPGLEIFTMNLSGADLYKVTTSDLGLSPFGPEWHPAGDWILFYAGPADDEELYVVRPDGTDITQLTCNSVSDVYASFSPDGKYIYYQSKEPVFDRFDIVVMELEANILDCYTPVVSLTGGDGISEYLPRATITPDGRPLLSFYRREIGVLNPPPGTLDCPVAATYDYTWTSFNFYLMPIDPATGLATGGMVMWIDSSSLREGRYAWGPAGTSIMFPAGGCQEAEFYCHPPSGTWYLDCKAGETRNKGFFRVVPPPSLTDPNLPYSLTTPFSAYYNFITYSYKDPSWIDGSTHSFSDWGGEDGTMVLTTRSGSGPTMDIYRLTLDVPELSGPTSVYTVSDPAPMGTFNLSNSPSTNEFLPRLMPPLWDP